jgi:hypothetical protein
MTFAVDCASVHARQHEFRALFFVKENASFHASHGLGDFLGNAINELIKVENRIDSLGGPL